MYYLNPVKRKRQCYQSYMTVTFRLKFKKSILQKPLICWGNGYPNGRIDVENINKKNILTRTCITCLLGFLVDRNCLSVYDQEYYQFVNGST